MREMQDPENGVPVRSQKLFLTSIPSAFMGQFFLPFLAQMFFSFDSFRAFCGLRELYRLRHDRVADGTFKY